MVSSNPEHEKMREKFMATPHSALSRKWRNAINFIIFDLFHRFYKKNCNISFEQLRKRISEYQNMDIDYNIGHYRSEMGLSGLGSGGYFVTFVAHK